MTRDVVRIQHKTFFLGKLPQWKFLSGKGIPFVLQCISLAVQKFFVEQTLGFISYVIILWHLRVLPREIYNLYSRNIRDGMEEDGGELILLVK